MNDKKENISELKTVVSKDFDKFDEFALLTETDFNTLDEFRKYLAEKISDLMIKNFDDVLSILYRIDISEMKVMDAIHSNNERKAELLADLIIERQLEKIKTRRKFKNSSNTDFLDY